MPIIYQKHFQPEGELGLWRIAEPEDWFLEKLELSAPEKAQFDAIQGHRRVEYLAVRQLVHQMSGREKRGPFIKDEYGKPHLEGSRFQISISHSREVAAAIAAPCAVGIDIQQIVEKIERLAPRFLSPAELANIDPAFRMEHLHVYWCAKEALYKAYGRRELVFTEHLEVDPFPFFPQEGPFTGRIKKEGSVLEMNLWYEHFQDYILVYALEPGRR